MVLYYAAGGGLGHLTRARAVLSQLGLLERATLLTSSRFAHDPRVAGGLRVVPIPAEFEHDRTAYRAWLLGVLGEADELWVDAFPAGVLGELCGLDTGVLRLVHVARRLRWAEYAERLNARLPRFDRTYLLEPLEAAHRAALEACSRRVEVLELDVREPEPLALDDPPLWLVVHSGPQQEVGDLLAYAREQREAECSSARIVVVSPSPPPGAEALDLYPAAALYPRAARIYTACGFNAMHETRAFRDRHRFVPYARPLDDQYARAAAARAMLDGRG